MALPVASTAFPEDDDNERAELARLAGELRRLQLRYGIADVGSQRLDDRVRSRRGRIRIIDEQLAELAAERRRLVTEIAGYQKALHLARISEIERLRQVHAEAWSPFAIRAYRIWHMRQGRLFGAAQTLWEEPELTAVCGRGAGRDEVPHSDGRCGVPPCGIYASKHPDVLVRNFAAAWPGAMGLVELTGKVVEHAAGYRAERARVVALAVVAGGRWLTTDDPDVIAAAFHDPTHALARWGQLGRTRDEPWGQIIEYLMEREAGPWTSESNSA
jgi:chorismate mutase